MAQKGTSQKPWPPHTGGHGLLPAARTLSGGPRFNFTHHLPTDRRAVRLVSRTSPNSLLFWITIRQVRACRRSDRVVRPTGRQCGNASDKTMYRGCLCCGLLSTCRGFRATNCYWIVLVCSPEACRRLGCQARLRRGLFLTIMPPAWNPARAEPAEPSVIRVLQS